jgi:hypothetical protein
MKSVEISDELYDKLKGFVVDPFDDTAEIVISRLVEIANKAKNRWSPLDRSEEHGRHGSPMAERTRMSNQESEYPEESPVLL